MPHFHPKVCFLYQDTKFKIVAYWVICLFLFLDQILSEGEFDDTEIQHLQERADRLVLREYNEQWKAVMMSYFIHSIACNLAFVFFRQRMCS